MSAASAQPLDVAGAWRAEGDYFRATVLIERDADGAWAAFFADPDLARGARLTSAAVRGDSLFLVAAEVGAAFRGAVSEAERRVVGTWTQGDVAVALTLVPAETVERTGSRPAARPQEPAPPYPYASEAVVFEGGRGVRLAGTLTVPDGRGPHPAVVLVPGTGDNDRDYEMDGHRPFLVLADHLTRRGVAVLRYDERGVGGSGGDPFATRFDDEASDVAAAVRLLRDRPEVDAGRVGIVGHSVGGVVAPTVHRRLERAAFLVLLMAPSTPLGPLLQGQGPRMAAAHGASGAVVEAERALGTALVTAATADTDSLTAAAAMAAAYEAAGWPDGMRDAGVRANTSPAFRDLVRHDPGPALEQIDVPVLAIYGRSDLAVAPEDNAAPMLAALTASPSPDATVRVLAGLNHALRPSETELEDEPTGVTVDPVVLALLAEWIGAHAAPE